MNGTANRTQQGQDEQGGSKARVNSEIAEDGHAQPCSSVRVGIRDGC